MTVATERVRPTILVTTRSFGSGDADPEELLVEAGLRVARGDHRHDVDVIGPLLRRAAGWIAGTGPIGAVHLEAAPDLRIVARYGIGVDSVDVAAAHERNIVVTNTPGANAEAVADHTVAMLLACVRQLVAADRDLRSGSVGRYVGRELASLTCGLIGLGRVGRAVARRLTALGVTVAAHDPAVEPDDATAAGVVWRPLDELVATCDVVSLHCPGGGPPVLDRRRLAALPRGAIVINTARPDVVDALALAEFLHEGHLGAAALDVVEDPHDPLHDAPRTILTPHIAGVTEESNARVSTLIARQVLAALDG